jgi:hypothetical protein
MLGLRCRTDCTAHTKNGPAHHTTTAWIESFFGHLKTENPHLDTITDPSVLCTELDARREHYNTVRLHEAIGYVTPADEHYGRGEATRQAQKDGIAAARTHRIATRRAIRHTHIEPTSRCARSHGFFRQSRRGARPGDPG